MIVVDASALVGVLADENESARRLRRFLLGEELTAPHVIDVEVLSALRRARRIGRIGADRAAQALGDLALLPLRRVGHTSMLARAWELRDNVAPHDAMYVALAEHLRAPLLTADARLARAPGIRCDVQLVT
jgi:predicted nucleic acid-binding protein